MIHTIYRHIAEEVDLELPHYRKAEPHFYKVLTDSDCIQVFCGSAKTSLSIGIHHAGLAFSNDTVECTRDEFEAAFTRVHEALLELAK